MGNDIYREYALSLLRKLKEQINGYIVFELYPDADMVMIRTTHKGFDYNHVFNDVKNRVLDDNDSAVEEFMEGYKKDLDKCFIKSEEKKAWEKKNSLKVASLLEKSFGRYL